MFKDMAKMRKKIPYLSVTEHLYGKWPAIGTATMLLLFLNLVT